MMWGDGPPSDRQGTPLLSLDDLHVRYGSSHVLKGIDLTVRAGEAVALLGRNGMGKTTLLRAVMGLGPVAAGAIRFDGHPINGWRPHHIARAGVALVPEGRGIFANLTVRENLVLAARPPGSDRTQAVWTMTDVAALFPRLTERLSQYGNQLSGGEQQMLAIARALLTNPRLLLIDEATEGLAPAVRDEIWGVIARIRDAGLASVVVDKDLHALLALCDRALVLVKGEVVYAGASADLARTTDILKSHLGV